MKSTENTVRKLPAGKNAVRFLVDFRLPGLTSWVTYVGGRGEPMASIVAYLRGKFPGVEVRS